MELRRVEEAKALRIMQTQRDNAESVIEYYIENTGLNVEYELLESSVRFTFFLNEEKSLDFSCRYDNFSVSCGSIFNIVQRVWERIKK